MTHYAVQFNSVISVGSLEHERFQGTLEDWRVTHQHEFCWQPVLCSGCGNRKRPLAEFQTGPMNPWIRPSQFLSGSAPEFAVA